MPNGARLPSSASFPKCPGNWGVYHAPLHVNRSGEGGDASNSEPAHITED